MMHPRHSAILELVNNQGKISVTELAAQIGVSEVTIRQDLTQLDADGLLKRVHGAAISLDSDDPSHRLWANSQTKHDLAQFAFSQIPYNDCVLIEGGSANVLLAKMLGERGRITIITPSSYIAHELRTSQAEVILLGGQYQGSSESLVGPLTRLCIEHIHFSKAFIGVDGFSMHNGFTNKNLLRAEVANAILQKGEENFIMTDSRKFNRIYAAGIGPIERINHVITDANIPAEAITWLTEQHVQVHQV